MGLRTRWMLDRSVPKLGERQLDMLARLEGALETLRSVFETRKDVPDWKPEENGRISPLCRKKEDWEERWQMSADVHDYINAIINRVGKRIACLSYLM